jgi:Tol biopolymer transport system component/DNA-binding winged helix-turn-helix (wHTH) protein
LPNPSRSRFGPFFIDVQERVLRRDGQPVPLTPKAFDLLAAFIDRAGRLIPKEELLQTVWPDTFVEESNLAYNVFALRKALGDTAENGHYIETVPKRGYRFTAAVTPVTSGNGQQRQSDVSADGKREPSGEEFSLSIPPKGLSQDVAPPGRLTIAGPRELETTILPFLRRGQGRRAQTTADPETAPEELVSASNTPPENAVLPPSRSFARRWASVALVSAALAVLYFAVESWRAPPAPEALHSVPLISLPGGVRSPSLSPDGNYVVFTWTGAKQDNPDLYVQQIGAGSPLRLTTDPANDYSPSWSPDGRTIAFLRRAPAGLGSELRVIAPLGGPERKVAHLQPRTPSFAAHSLGWCPNSGCVLVTDASRNGELDAIFMVMLDSGEKRQLTYPQGMVVDTDPAVSPDGRWLVFRRDSTPFSGIYYRVSLGVQMAPQGDAVRLTSTLRAGKPAWMPDSREFLFAGRGWLWSLDARVGGTPARLPFLGQDGLTPVVSRTPNGQQRLVYVRSFADVNVWRVDTSAAGAPASSPPVAAIASTRIDGIPNLSPDGSRLVFSSDRSGETEFWLADLNGSNAVQLTSMAILPGFPRWSPDSTLIAFHGDPEGRPDVLVVPARGGKPTTMTAGMPNGGFPSFSRDGQWIYFTVMQMEGPRIWKIPVSGGAAVQITQNAGTLAIESVDGRDLYYVEAADRPSPLWHLPLTGGAPVKLIDGVLLGNFDVVEGGIYYIDRGSGEAGVSGTDRAASQTRLQFFDFATRRSATVMRNLGTVRFGLTASRDGRTIFYARVDSSVDELILVDGFR